MVDVESISEELTSVDGVVVSRDYKYMCSDPGQELIINNIKEHNLNRVVVAACSPRIHEATFRKALEKAGLNPYMFQMANIREQDAWVHSNREEATEKAKSLIKAAIKRVKFHEALNRRLVDIHPATLVIGGGIAGISTALNLANANQKVFLVEKENSLGGMTKNIKYVYPSMLNAREFINEKITALLKHPNVETYTDTRLKEIYGYMGNFETKFNYQGRVVELEFGNVVLATGLQVFNPIRIPEYEYKELPDIITSLEFEQMLLAGSITKQDGTIPEHIVIIHCVGSNSSNYQPYCSRTCCSTALKFAALIKAELPGSNIYDLYTDMRCYGKGCEEMFTKTSKDNIMFLMFKQEKGLPQILSNEKDESSDMLVHMKEELSGENIEIPADMVILMAAVKAHDDAKEVAHLAGVSMCGNDFFIEKHPKLDPVATSTDGVYIVGGCQGPKSIDESIAQANAASARILASIIKGKAEIEVTTAQVEETICCGCKTCMQVCPYSAIDFNNEKNVSGVNEVLCKGCGTCSSSCPTGAIRTRHFTDQQIVSQIEGVLG
jgi:heterodisulfide reductase subunit A